MTLSVIRKGKVVYLGSRLPDFRENLSRIICSWCGAVKTYSGMDASRVERTAWEDGWDSHGMVCPACICPFTFKAKDRALYVRSVPFEPAFKHREEVGKIL
jgi:hypothetical protein